MQPAALFAAGLAAGLLVGTASCAAVQGGLLFGLASRPGRQPLLVPTFAVGRLLSHVAVGGLLGLLGSAVRLGPQVRAVLLMLLRDGDVRRVHHLRRAVAARATISITLRDRAVT